MAYCGPGARFIGPPDHFKGGIEYHATPAPPGHATKSHGSNSKVETGLPQN